MRLFLAGDLMAGRGVDAVLPKALRDGTLREGAATHARDYVEYARRASLMANRNKVERSVEDILGDLLPTLDARAPLALRLVNLETALTTSTSFSQKAVNYRASRENGIALLEALHIDVVTLANNHLMDFGSQGLIDTLEGLDASSVRRVGAGRAMSEAFAVKRIDRSDVTASVFGACMLNSGVPCAWYPGMNTPGVALLRTEDDVRRLLSAIEAERRWSPFWQHRLIVVSLHAGSNWGWNIEPEIVRLARAIVDSGADVVHGHSSHHARRAELYRGKLILYGCGELLNDYEGIRDWDGFPARDFGGNLRFAYFPEIDASTGEFRSMEICIFKQTDCFCVRHAPVMSVEHELSLLKDQYLVGGMNLAYDSNSTTLVATPSQQP